jgi:hypothetical protein
MYFPQSLIKPNQYTNGDKYVLSTTNQLYTGYYFETYNGKIYTGKDPNDTPNILLVNIQDITPQLPSTDSVIPPSPVNRVVDPNFILPNTSARYLPQSIVSLPTSSDYEVGYFTRYFCKKNNELKYMETDEETYNKLSSKSSTIAWDLYSPSLVNWYIVGDEQKTYLINKTSVQLVERDNQWYGFTNWFKGNFAKYLAL